MAQISIIQKADINEAGRFDAEYFKPEYLEIERKIKRLKHSNIATILGSKNVFSGPFGSTLTSHSYRKSGIPFIRISDIQDIFIKKDNLVYISNSESERLESTTLNTDDIVLSKIGTIGRLSLITQDLGEINISENNIGLRLKNLNITEKRLLLFFLLSKFGQQQIFRKGSGNVQIKFNVKDIDNLLIPNFSLFDLEYFENIYNEIVKKQSQAKDLYAEAENLLLVELDLLDYQPKHHLTFSATKADIEQTQRFDAEYFQPKYGDIIQKIENYAGGFDILDYFIKNYSTGFPFKSDSYTDKGCYLIRINNIEKGRLNLENANKIPENDTNLSVKDIAKEGDILISMSGTIGNSCKIPKGINAVINQRIFRFTSINFNKETLTLLINSLVGLSQLQRIGTGGVQTNISGNDIRKLKIPLINQKTQNQIAEKITLSHTLRKQSKALLELAKTKVEQEIER